MILDLDGHAVKISSSRSAQASVVATLAVGVHPLVPRAPIFLAAVARMCRRSSVQSSGVQGSAGPLLMPLRRSCSSCSCALRFWSSRSNVRMYSEADPKPVAARSSTNLRSDSGSEMFIVVMGSALSMDRV